MRHYPFLICRSFYAYVGQVRNAFQDSWRDSPERNIPIIC
ncbi:hypothetical protein SD15574_5292 [Shigella dysenteriae 155-74]|nr:hypothetical protein SD15574_5292 [Shigella dysenteriae 155-74]EIQ22392.1 fructose-1,6-bisphosphatase domain protein [Shigella boydii 965-58]